ncbi:MAG: hypothetical protein II823_03560 [Kiritimatiellae bacterium]|nr:hypothetical protein [Kiritimatiellia bacterium]
MALITNISNATGVLISKAPLVGKVDEQTLVYEDPSGNKHSLIVSFFQEGTQTITRYDGFDETTAKAFAAAHTVQDTISVAVYSVNSTIIDGHGGYFDVHHAYVSAASRATVRHKAGRMYFVEVEEISCTVTSQVGVGQ